MIYPNKPNDFNSKFDIAFCICEFNDRLLFLQRQSNKPQGGEWGVPAGKVDNNETTLMAAQRELKEETGIDVSTENFKFITTSYDRFPNLDFTVHIYHTILENDKVVLNPKEHINYSWVTPSKALTMNHMQDVDLLLKLFYKDL